MKFLAIDPSSTELGWAVFEDEGLVVWGGISTQNVAYNRRFMRIIGKLKKLLKLYDFKEIACEEAARFQGRPAPELEIAVRSIVKWAKDQKIPCALYNPSTWRSSVIGNARATKEETAALMRLIHQDLPAGVSDHITDAVAIGQYHAGVRKIEGMSAKESTA